MSREYKENPEDEVTEDEIFFTSMALFCNSKQYQKEIGVAILCPRSRKSSLIGHSNEDKNAYEIKLFGFLDNEKVNHKPLPKNFDHFAGYKKVGE